MGVPATKLHEVVGPIGADFGGDVGCNLARAIAIAELVDVLHGFPSSACASSANSASVRSASSGSILPMA